MSKNEQLQLLPRPRGPRKCGAAGPLPPTGPGICPFQIRGIRHVGDASNRTTADRTAQRAHLPPSARTKRHLCVLFRRIEGAGLSLGEALLASGDSVCTV